MATYQGATWLDVQLATIFAQDHRDWHLLIRDDGSTDDTRAIIRSWRDRFPEKITFLDEDKPSNLGAIGNFSALLAASSARYVMFANWDDVWYPDKVSRAVASIARLEARHGAECPIWIQTDVRVVDQNLVQLHRSAWRYQRMAPYRNQIVGRCVLECQAGGATAIANRALVRIGSPIPAAARYFDWWLILVAVAFGVTEAQPHVSMDWRRHGTNRSGVDSFRGALRSVLRNPMRHRRAFYEKLATGQQMARLLLEQFREKLSARDRAAAEAFLLMQQLGFWSRRATVIRHRILFTSRLRTAGLLLLM